MPALLETRNLVKEFGGRRHWLARSPEVRRAVDHVSLQLAPAETLGLAGESGSGKSTLGRLILRLLPATAGAVLWEGNDILPLPDATMRELRREMQVVFQDPYRSLNPRQTLEQILGLPFRLHHGASPAAAREEAMRLLAETGLNPARHYIDRFPHELSGGQRQRVAIARAVALKPKLVVADEPVTALDVSVRAQILGLMKDLRERYGLAYIFITHDLAVLRSLADRVAVMYQGQIVEEAPREAFYADALHPYSQALLAATPVANPRESRARQRLVLRTDDDTLSVRQGCRFHPRCPRAMDQCRSAAPPLVPVAPGHRVACHLYPASEGGGQVAP